MFGGGYLTFVDSDDWIDEDHLASMVTYISSYDWVMVGMRYVNNDNEEQETKTVPIKTIAKGSKDLDEICPTLPQFCWVTNKLYNSALIQRNKLSFMEESHIHEDRIFNLNYLQFINSLVMLPSATYNYLVNPLSLSHKNIVIRKCSFSHRKK